MESFEKIHPESKTQEQGVKQETEREEKKEEEKSEDLGLERVKDIEKARVMAANENLFRAKEKAYEHYLEHPEAHTAEERVQFSQWKENKIAPSDVLELGERLAKVDGNMYDVETRIRRLEKEGSRLGLIKEATVSGIKAFGRMLTIDFWHIPRATKEILWNKRGYIGFFGTKESSEAYQKFLGDIVGFMTAVDALRKINKGEKEEGLKYFEDNYAEDLLKKAETWQVPSFFHEAGSKEETEIKGEKELSKEPSIEGRAEAEGKEEKRKTKRSETEREVNPAAKATNYIFNWIAEKYSSYLKSPEDKETNPLFRKLKEAGVFPEDIRKEGIDTGRWVSGLTEWEMRLVSFNEEQLKSEQLLNFYDLLIRVFSKKKITKVGKARDLVAPILKMYRSSAKLSRLENK